MYCIRKVTEDVTWIGADDRRLAMFEGVYSVPKGVSYNSYLLLDEKAVLFDTVDKAVGRVFFENLAHVLAGRPLEYVIVQHMEPDHSATLAELLLRHPETEVVCSEKSAMMIGQFFSEDYSRRIRIVKEGETLSAGKHQLTFYSAPMVHWPEVMVTYDHADKILFSADAFGTFGALNGAVFADEMDFFGDYLDEARRYYANIIGKYSLPVQQLLKKAAGLDIAMVCPLHGPVWRKDFAAYLEKYRKWSAYEPEEAGVMIAYASIYGNTENAANILACRLSEKGVRTVMFDVSVTPASEIIAAAFKWSHLVFAAPTYNMGVFVTMDALLRDLAAHAIQNRTVMILENGSWAPASGKLMREILGGLKGVTILEETLTLKSSLRENQMEELFAAADVIAASVEAGKSGISQAEA
ncbi:MAG TPA: FprA family A-type flavoprotein [Oscillospiraceae bacterium]|nr:FprA family A-type flavoprotein [Oscillospiraceae bacterium]HRW57252.1 FprA family A-type flavoprotein [Oscillospiraceae bacterium]